MKFSYNLIKKFVETKLPAEKLAEILSLKTAEVEEITQAGDDQIMEVKILYNRGDLLSHYGMAREIAAVAGGKLNPLKAKLKESKTKASSLLNVAIKNPDKCYRYNARVIENIQVGESPSWLKEALNSLGLRSINNIVDVTNYVMVELGQPLHAFDYDKISGKQITVRNAAPGEKIKTLDEMRSDYELSPDVLVIADAEKPLAIAGIKGGIGSEITEKTKTIILESANFDKSAVRRTATKLGLRTDASVRFSYGLDPNLTEVAINRAAELISQLTGGEIAGGIIDVYPKKLKPWKVAVKKSYISSLIGADIPEKLSKNILQNLGMSPATLKDKFVVMVPTYRLDIQTAEDVIEEIARIYGYENIKSIPPYVPLFTHDEEKSRDDWDLAEKIRARELMQNILKSLAFSEVYNYSFLSEETRDSFDINNAPEIANPVSSEAKYLRTSIIPNLVVAARNNLRFYSSFRLFEAGHVFSKEEKGINEREQIAGLIVSKDGFHELKGLVISFLKQLGMDDFEFNDAVSETYEGKHWYHPGQVATIKIDGEIVGIMGNLNPQISNRLDLKKEVNISLFSFNLQKLVNAMETELEFEPIPKYPSVIRDISLLVNTDVRIEQILNVINENDSMGIIQDVDVFDIYEPDAEEDADGVSRKSVAFHVIFRSNERTLTVGEVDQTEKHIKTALRESLEAEVR